MITRRLWLQALLACAFLLAGCASHMPLVRSAVIADLSPAPSTPPTPAREDLMNPIVLKDALTNIEALEKTFEWKPFRPGVEIARIYTTPDGGPSAALLRYAAGASVPFHLHSGYEHIFILRGTQLDRTGEHGPGSVIINPPGSSHNVSSPNGCVVFIVWEKPVIIAT